MNSYINMIIRDGIDAETTGSREEHRVTTGQRSAQEGRSYFWNPAVFKETRFVNTQPNAKRRRNQEE